MVITGHEHSYSRTKNMNRFSNQSIANEEKDLTIKPGQTWCVVSGLGGREIRPWRNDLEKNPWWAECAASDNGVNYGALLCTFNIDKNPRKGHCDFKDITGKIWDSFDIYTENSDSVPSTMSTPLTPSFIEIPIRSGSDDGLLHSSLEGILPLSKNSVWLTFRDIPLDKYSNLEAVHLQMYGAVGSEPKSNDIRNGNILIQARVGSQAISTEVVWSNELEIDEFEQNEVWVTPNLKKMILEIITTPIWSRGQDITLILTNRESSDIRMFAYDYSPCFAPTLAIELKV